WRELSQRLKEGDTLRWLSRLSWFAGRRAEAERYSTEAIAALEALPPGPELAMAYSNRAQLDMLGREIPSAIDWAQRTLKLAEPMGNQDIVSHALNNLGTARLISGDPAGWDDLAKSLQIALAQGHQEHAARAYTNLGSAGVIAREYDRGDRYLREGIAYCDDR